MVSRHLTTTGVNSSIRGVKPIKAMTIRLSADQSEALDLVASIDGQSVSQVIRAAIAEHIEERKSNAAFRENARKRITRAQRMLLNEG